MRHPKQNVILHAFRAGLEQISPLKRALILRALGIAVKQHSGQKKFGLWNYILHPMGVFNSLFWQAGVKNETVLSAALLHDSIEDGQVNPRELANDLGGEVAQLVTALTRYRPINESEVIKTEHKRQHLTQLTKASFEVQLIKLADIYDNMLGWQYIPLENPNYGKQPRWISEVQLFIRLIPRPHRLTKLIEKELKNHA